MRRDTEGTFFVIIVLTLRISHEYATKSGFYHNRFLIKPNKLFIPLVPHEKVGAEGEKGAEK